MMDKGSSQEAAEKPEQPQQQPPMQPASTINAPPARKPRRRKKGQSQSPPTKDMIPLSPNFQPGKLDVICSRGKFAYNSPGNCWFRCMVEEQMDNYSNAKTKTDKSLVVSILVNRVRHAAPEGGFVKNVGGRWYRVSDRYSREKVGQQFRDLLHLKYKSSTKAKAEKRKRAQDIGNGEHPELERSGSSFDGGNTDSFNSRDRVPSAASTAYNTDSYNSRDRLDSYNSRDRLNSASNTDSYNSRDRLDSHTSRDRMSAATDSHTSRDRMSAATDSYTSRDRMSAATDSYNSRDRLDSHNSRDRLSAASSSTYGTPQPSPASSTYMSPAHYGLDDQKMPALELSSGGTTKKAALESFKLEPRSPPKQARLAGSATVAAAAAKLSPPDEEDDVKKLDAVDVNMELESLGDFEPLPMLGSGNDPTNNMNFTFASADDLHQSFPTIFNPPDFHQSMPDNLGGGGADDGSNNSGKRNSNSNESNGANDPFFTPWHMSI
ncbi:Nitrilase family, member 2 [Seminavis robusta]|uniref:Nitrilase family, member 2 n=1 Tax=Seminavis robusta TaxID=568900 RepID=A0A9N8E7C0_9STRA|nr:Nitrilase family, member 2 [Seminavis robusta]|eukprot:Sro743_g196100.1 Nitrilase family, member 2 (492) ;mRNA; f:35356-37139